MKILITLVACLYSIICFGQTKLISFRSHSGNNANFRTAVEHNLFDLPNSNFGIAVFENIDSVIMQSKGRIIVLKSFSHDVNRKRRYGFYRDTLTRANASDFFTATSMQNLKAVVQKKYGGAFSDSTFFIGFDNKFKNSKNAPKK
ncbi:MAG TPA: hypothetical protein VF008_10815 [Niastella sp.]